jgi:subtilisin family serine protease
LPSTRTQRRSDTRRIAPLGLIALGATLLLVGAGTSRSREPSLSASAAAWRGLVGAPRPPVAIGQRMLVVLRSPSMAQRVADAGGRATEQEERRWTAAALAAQEQLIAEMAQKYGVQIRPSFNYARVLNGFSAALDASAVSLLERQPDVAGVYPVRAAYPASLSSRLLGGVGLAQGAGHSPQVLLPGFDGRGVTIALLDTGVDRAHPFLRGRILPGIDLIGDDYGAVPKAEPGDATRFERHGTEMAGLLVGAGGPAGVEGVATGASVLPIRVAGWQHDATGSWAVYARTDQLVAGLERAVDPNEDGDAHDAARIALVPLAEPYAAFADSPTVRAVQGALRLDTLVVAPAGNDGPAGPAYGSLSSPGGAAAALSVGAADLRAHAEELRLVLRSGLSVLVDEMVPLAGAVVPSKALDLEVAAPTSAPNGKAPSLAAFFDGHGFSLVAGRAALVPTGDDPQTAVENAARAGASAVLLDGGRVPAGGLGLNESVAVPVVGISDAAGKRVLDALARGSHPVASIGVPRLARNASLGRIAAFSSRGLAYDGRVKPDLAAPGVALTTADPGLNDDGSARYGTVSGSSAAAAVVAGAAAVLAQARPALDALALRSALAGSARPLRSDDLTAQGTGIVDIGAAAADEVAVDPPTLAFGRATKAGWKAQQALVVRNLSSRPLRLFVGTGEGGGAGLVVSASPARLHLRPGGAALVRVRAHLVGGLLDGPPASGTLEVGSLANPAVRIPWVIPFGAAAEPFLSDVALSVRRFKPSDTNPAVLSLRAGRLAPSQGGAEIEPLSRLDVELWSSDYRNLGLLARLRDVLPGRYAFGLTGRDPEGNNLVAGDYHVKLIAVPVDASKPSVRWLGLTIK